MEITTTVDMYYVLPLTKHIRKYYADVEPSNTINFRTRQHFSIFQPDPTKRFTKPVPKVLIFNKTLPNPTCDNKI